MLQLRFRSHLLQELLLSGTHYETLSPRWLRYHPSEASCLLHHARRRAHPIDEISVRRLAIPDRDPAAVRWSGLPALLDYLQLTAGDHNA